MNNIIFFADDDYITRQIMQTYLEKEGFQVKCFDDCEGLYEAYREAPCDMIIINTVIQGRDGLITGAKLRQISRVPIIVLAAEESDEEYIFCISLGMDAYLAKPLCPTKLVAHVRALRIRSQLQSAPPPPKLQAALEFADITICREKIITSCNGQDLKLTNTEFKVLEYMLENQERAVVRSEILNKVWGSNRTVGFRAVDDVVKRLRKKMAGAASRVYIDTVWGFGFRLGTKPIAQ